MVELNKMQQIIKQVGPSRQLFETVNFAFMNFFDFLVKIVISGAFLQSFGDSRHALLSRSSVQMQGLRSEFQSPGANHYLMTLIQSKTVHFSFFSQSFWKIDGCKWGFLKIDGCNCTRCTRPYAAPEKWKRQKWKDFSRKEKSHVKLTLMRYSSWQDYRLQPRKGTSQLNRVIQFLLLRYLISTMHFLKIDGCNCTRCTRPNGAPEYYT